MTLKIDFETDMPEDEARRIIEAENAKDMKEAETLVKVFEGKSSELGYMRKRVAGQALSQFTKFMGTDKREFILANLKERVAKGAEGFVSCSNGHLIVEFDEFGKMGSDYMHRTKHAEKKLMKRFRAKSMRYIVEGTQ